MDLPCDGEGLCMRCKARPPEAEVIPCRICAAPWHVQCLTRPPPSMAAVADWQCPDCSPSDGAGDAAAAAAAVTGPSGELVAAIRKIEDDVSLTEREKAKRRQKLMSGVQGVEDEAEEVKKAKGGGDVLDLLDAKFNCAFCMQLPERPVTTPCGHNFCLKCFQRWIGQGKYTCAKCRTTIPTKMASLPRINLSLVAAIRMARAAKSVNSGGSGQVYHYIRNEERPEKAFTTERAVKTGKANACSGQIFVTIPPDYFGPILAEYDPRNNRGILVGDSWEDRMECRQWGAHFPHVGGIGGQCNHGAQSVALSGGYEDDEDHGEWFLYTGSGGRDLSGNKRTNKLQSSEQKFEKYNEALRVSCKKGYPVRVVRSHKEKRSSYAPESGVRYDGVYRIEKCWRKAGIQGFTVCRFLFVRCDNEPAPWTSEEHGDRPRPLPVVKELKNATDVTERKGSAAWDYNDKDGWHWTTPQPASKKKVMVGDPSDVKRMRSAGKVARNTSVKERLLKEFSCLLCRKVMSGPLTTPCGHNFCRICLLDSYADKSFVRKRGGEGGRSLRAQKIVKKCPRCPTDITDFLQDAQVNREILDLIESLQRKCEEEQGDNSGDPHSGSSDNDDGADADRAEEGSEESELVVTAAEDDAPVTEEDGDDGEHGDGVVSILIPNASPKKRKPEDAVKDEAFPAKAKKVRREDNGDDNNVVVAGDTAVTDMPLNTGGSEA